MSRWINGERARWALAASVAAILVGIVLTLFRLPSPLQSIEPIEAEGPDRVGLTKVMQGEAVFLDKRPLFLPTEWNTAQKKVYPPQSGGAFSDYAPKFAYDESELKSLKPSAPGSLSVADALSLAPPGPALLGFGRSDLKITPFEARGAYIEIVDAKDGQRVFAKGMPQAKPPTTTFWAPLEFLAKIDAAGLTGPLVLTSRSGMEEVDAYFQKYLTQNFRIGVLLEPGVYRISVGP
jgi:hypothetical protein